MLVALDVDGTLITGDLRLSPRVTSAVQAVSAAGHHVIIATGRSIGATLPVVGALDLGGCYAVCSNGAFTVRTTAPPALVRALERGRGARFAFGADAVSSATLPTYAMVDVATFDPWPALMRIKEVLPGASFAVETDTADFLVSATFPAGEVSDRVQRVGLDALRGVKAARVVVASDAHTPEEFLEISSGLGLSGVNYAVGYSAWIDIAPEGTSKASALEAVRERLGVAPGATVAIGDGRNDVEMLAWAARSAAMGGSPPEVVAAATEVTASVEDDGAALVLESLLR